MDQRQLDNLKDLFFADLSVRDDNNHVGSEFGGNKTQLLFLLSKNVIFALGKEDQENEVEASEDDSLNLSFKINHKTSSRVALLRSLRRALDSFCESKSLTPITDQQLIDPEFLKVQTIHPSNQAKIDFLIESSRILKEFRKKLEEKRNDVNQNSICECPELSNEEKNLFSDFLKNDPFISILSFRTIVGIDLLVEFNLDEHAITSPVLQNNNNLFENIETKTK